MILQHQQKKERESKEIEKSSGVLIIKNTSKAFSNPINRICNENL